VVRVARDIGARMGRHDRGGLVASVIAVILAATACASAAGQGPGSTGTGAPARDGEVQCPTTPRLPEPERENPVPADFRTAWVLRCSDSVRAVPGEGKWWFRIEERADTDAAALVTALRSPDEPTPPVIACTLVAIGVPYFALVDAAGTVVYPRVPRDRCGQPQRQALDALEALPFHETDATRLHQEQSQESIDTDCGQMWTDAPAGDMFAHTTPAGSRRIWEKTPDAVRICLWRPRTSGLPELVSAGTVTGADLAALLTRLDRLPAARPCTTGHYRFAVLEYIREGWYDSAAYAQIDGCRMILRPDNTLGQLDPATAELLTALSNG
jgi:hypothetical protein